MILQDVREARLMTAVPSNVAVGLASAEIVPANTFHFAMIFYPHNTTDYWVDSGRAAVIGTCIRVAANSDQPVIMSVRNSANWCQGSIRAIASAAITVGVVEVSTPF